MSKYIRAYEALCPDDIIAKDDPRRPVIMAEMAAIKRSKCNVDAAHVVAQWGVWPNDQHASALEFVSEARRIMQGGK